MIVPGNRGYLTAWIKIIQLVVRVFDMLYLHIDIIAMAPLYVIF